MGRSNGGSVEQPGGGEGLPPRSKRVRRTVGAVALLVGAALAVVGSFRPLFTQELTFTSESESLSMTLWGFRSSIELGGLTDDRAHYGLPVVAAAVLLVVSAALVVAASRLPSRFAGPTSLAAVAAAALLTGSVWTMCQLVLRTVMGESSAAVRTVVDTGTTLLVLACLVSLVGAVLVQHWPDSEPDPEPRPDPGAVVVYRLPDDDGGADRPLPGSPVPDTTAGGGT